MQEAQRSDGALLQWLLPFQPWLTQTNVTELCINRPHELFVEDGDGWTRHEMDILTADYCQKLARLIATYSHQKVDAATPLLSSSLPGQERVQIVISPACDSGQISITMRKPSLRDIALEDCSQGGTFAQAIWHRPSHAARQAGETLPMLDASLCSHAEGRDWAAFFRAAVRANKNIVIAGKTGSGKTTLGKSMAREIHWMNESSPSKTRARSFFRAI